ncbi:hypothetical protein CANCADRAFT_18024, partial [Tortispora caseinolytica NRRL Y-17796]
MAFWKFGSSLVGAPDSSTIDKLLEKPDCSVSDLIQDNNILTELSTRKANLIKFFTRPDAMEDLVNIIIDIENPDKTSPTSSASPSSSSSPTTSDDHLNTTHDESKQDELLNNDSDLEPSADSHTEKPEISTEDKQPKAKKNVEGYEDEEDEYEENDIEHGDDGEEHDEDKDEEEEDIEAAETRRRLDASVAAEILTGESYEILKALSDDVKLLNKIWTILDRPSPLPVLTASLFVKINEQLLERHTNELLEFMFARPNLVKEFTNHIDTPSLMDFLLKVISTDKPSAPTNVIDYLQQHDFIPALLSFFEPSYASSTQTAAGDVLRALIALSANGTNDPTLIGPNELTRQLVSPESSARIVQLMKNGGSALATAVGVIIEVIRKNNSDYDAISIVDMSIDRYPPSPRDPIYLGYLVKEFAENIHDFQTMLSRPHTERLKTAIGEIEPLGFERFKICELVAELLHCSNMMMLNNADADVIARERDAMREAMIRAGREMHAVEKEEANTHDPDDISDSNENSGSLQNTEKRDGSFAPEISKPDENSKEDSTPQSAAHTSADTAESRANSDAGLSTNPVVGDLLKMALVENRVMECIVNMFFEFPWNNFLHNVVFDIVQQIFGGPMEDSYNPYLAIDLFDGCQITERIIQGEKQSKESEETYKVRMGYMGHLTLIAEEVVKFTAQIAPESLADVVYDKVNSPEWEKYKSQTLASTRQKYNAILGGDQNEELFDGHLNDAMMTAWARSGSGRALLLQGVGDSDDDDGADEERGEERGEEEGDGDSFAQYMSQEINSDTQTRFISSDEDEDDE